MNTLVIELDNTCPLEIEQDVMSFEIDAVYAISIERFAQNEVVTYMGEPVTFEGEPIYVPVEKD